MNFNLLNCERSSKSRLTIAVSSVVSTQLQWRAQKWCIREEKTFALKSHSYKYLSVSFFACVEWSECAIVYSNLTIDVSTILTEFKDQTKRRFVDTQPINVCCASKWIVKAITVIQELRKRISYDDKTVYLLHFNVNAAAKNVLPNLFVANFVCVTFV